MPNHHTETDGDERHQIARELDQRALRGALWLGLLAAQRLNWPDITDRIVALVRDVDAHGAGPSPVHNITIRRALW